MMKKRILYLLLACGILCTTLVGCGKKEDSKKIVIWSNMEVESDIIKEYGEKWSAETGYAIEVIHETPDVQQFVQATNSSTGPDAIIGIANDQLANYVTAGLAAEVPTELYVDSEYAEAAIQACYVDGKKYAAPLAVETVALFYNTEKVENAPKTWDELVEIASTQGGIAFDATSIYYNLGFVRAFGSYIFAYENGTYDVSDMGLGNAEAVKAYEYILSLSTEYGFLSASISSDIAKSNFQNKETAFYIGGPWDVEGFTTAGTPFAVAPMPTLNGNAFVTPVGTQVSFVSAKSKNQEMAWDFIMYLSDNGAMDLYEVGDRIPAKLALQEQDVIQSNEISKAFISQISIGEPMPTVSELGQVWTPYSNNMKAMLNGEIDPTVAATNIEKQILEGIELMNSGK